MMVDATRPQTNLILAETAPLAKLTIMPFGLAPIILVPRHCINAMGCYSSQVLPTKKSVA